MAKKISKVLVIDASVARAAGPENATHPTAKYCRDFLNDTLEICHRVAMTPEISQEWRTHQSSYAKKWLTRMYGKKKVDYRTLAPDSLSIENIAGAQDTERDREAVIKDMHLIQAALSLDKLIVTLDENARTLFSKASGNNSMLRELVWVNPTHQDINPTKWLQNGAPVEKELMLGRKVR
jgi:hypothetical protein